MSVTEKDKTIIWQVKTKEGAPYKVESLDKLYQWIIENRIGSNDFVFSPREQDWIELAKLPDLHGCFWQLLTKDKEIYGPISLGELKQLYQNNQVTSLCKVSLFGLKLNKWVALMEYTLLLDWLKSKHNAVLDYGQFVSHLENRLGFKKPERKEESLSVKIKLLEKENKEQKKLIKDLNAVYHKIQEELDQKRIAVEEKSISGNQLEQSIQSLEERLSVIQNELAEKSAQVDQLNNQLVQSEVTHTLKVDEVKQLQEENIRKDRLMRESEGLLAELTGKNEWLNEKLISLENEVKENNRRLADFENKNSSAQTEMNLVLADQEAELTGLREAIKEKSAQNNKYQKELATLKNELNVKSENITELNYFVAEKEDILKVIKHELKEKENRLQDSGGEISNLKQTLAERNKEVNLQRGDIDNLQKELETLKQERVCLVEEYSARIKEKEELELFQKQQFAEELKTQEGERQEALVKERARHAEELKEKQLASEDLLAKTQEQFAEERKERKSFWEEKIAEQREHYEQELKAKEDSWLLRLEQFANDSEAKEFAWQRTINTERQNITRLEQELEALKREKDRIENEYSLILQEKEAFIMDQEKQFTEEIRNKEEAALKQSADLKDEFNHQVQYIMTEKEAWQEKTVKLEGLRRKVTEELKELQDQLSRREEYFKLREAELEERGQSLEKECNSLEQNLRQVNNEAADLKNKLQETSDNLASEITALVNLRKDFSAQSEDLTNTSEILEKTKDEKENLAVELSRLKQEFSQIQADLQYQVEDNKRNWQHAEEENRLLQGQFQMEKQKLTKEFTDNMIKHEKLQKRIQLEKEVQERLKMKEEVERLYDLLKQSSSGIEKGVASMQSISQSITDDIDKRNLSLKYMVEAEKREVKKDQKPKNESPKKTEQSRVHENLAEEGS